MAEFACPIVVVRDIAPIPEADLIELAVVGEYRSVIKRGQFRAGDHAIYLPEGSVLPVALLRQVGLYDDVMGIGKLNGPGGNRIKAIKLRGCLSQGILVELGSLAGNVGDDMAAVLGVIKYVPEVPENMRGLMVPAHGHMVKYDIDDFKMYPDVLTDGEEVVITEKLHGTFTGFGYVPGLDEPDLPDSVLIYSKGFGQTGLVFLNIPENDENVYVQMYRELPAGLLERLSQIYADLPVHILGETFGPGVQDMQYGQKGPTFRVFDIYIGHSGQGYFLDHAAMMQICHMLHLETVPVLYNGPWNRGAWQYFINGKEAVSGKEVSMREGIVVKPLIERHDNKLGRVILKLVSERYLLRKGGTEYN